MSSRELNVPTMRRRNAGSAILSRSLVNFLLLIVALYTFLPLIFSVLAALKPAGSIQTGRVLSLADFSPAANLHLLNTYHGGIFWRWMLNSALYAGLGALVSGLISIAAGHAFDKYDFPGKGTLFGFVLLGILVPSAATTLPLYIVASKVGVVNTFWSVFLPSLLSPFGVYLGRIFSAGYVPKEVIEAARIDGASELRLFTSIALPMTKSGLATVMLFQFSAIWNNFYLPLVMLNNEKLYPTSLGIYILDTGIASEGPQYLPIVVMGAVISIVPLIIVFAAMQRFWKAGLTAGSVK